MDGASRGAPLVVRAPSCVFLFCFFPLRRSSGTHPLVVMEDRRVFWGGGGRGGATRFRVFSDIFYEAHSRWLLPYVLVQSSFVGPATKTLDRSFGGIFSRKFWGWRGQKFLGKKTFLNRFLRGNFSRKFWGWRGQKILGKKNTSLTRKFSGKISSPKISSGNFGSNSPSRGNFEAQNFLETRGNFGIT